MEEIPSPGVPNYVSELVSYLSRRPELQGWVPDGTLLALWLMTLMNRGWGGGGGGIILDVDVSSSRRPGGATGRATRQAVTSVFGFRTKLLHLNAHSTASSVSLTGAQACVVTGLEHVSSPVAIKLRREVEGNDALLIWVRDEDYDAFPPWLLSRSATASLDAFVRAHTVLSSSFHLPPGWREAMAAWKKRSGRSATPFTVGEGGMGDWASKAGERPKPAAVFGPETQVEDCERRGGENMLYALEGSAEDRVKHCKLPHVGELDENDRRAAQKRREDLDEDLVDILEEV
ncbi:hypothetical protein A1Q2_02135 [Trichosporon asahii var. asahii CBS 8904]|uniref:Uncharacterized protein n=1 Tax=Trichosporon asahii var. asahii (strain CBS 8904) TaxID=1220162 RepID=K1VVR0_TRIAC|nr:hypothetical protein A1Q2_02135 [Trichosporon asahii var. asahii CBS 8904]